MKLSIIGLTLASLLTSGLARAEDTYNAFPIVEGTWEVTQQDCFLKYDQWPKIQETNTAVCQSPVSRVTVKTSEDRRTVWLSLDNNTLPLTTPGTTTLPNGDELMEGMMENVSDDAVNIDWARIVIGADHNQRGILITFCPPDATSWFCGFPANEYFDGIAHNGPVRLRIRNYSGYMSFDQVFALRRVN